MIDAPRHVSSRGLAWAELVINGLGCIFAITAWLGSGPLRVALEAEAIRGSFAFLFFVTGVIGIVLAWQEMNRQTWTNHRLAAHNYARSLVSWFQFGMWIFIGFMVFVVKSELRNITFLYLLVPFMLFLFGWSARANRQVAVVLDPKKHTPGMSVSRHG